MNPFKGRHFQRDVMLWAVRWHCKYGISYRELQEMLNERCVNVEGVAPAKTAALVLHNPSDLCKSHMDITYMRVNGRWA